ncbi:hypothetical protein THAOC_18649, partial [Thalassiosira oceanica]
MKLLAALLALSAPAAHAFSAPAKAEPMPQTNTDASGAQIDPLLIRAARGEEDRSASPSGLDEAGR